MDSKALAPVTHLVSEDLDLEVAQAVLPSDLEKVIPPGGKGRTRPLVQTKFSKR